MIRKTETGKEGIRKKLSVSREKHVETHSTSQMYQVLFNQLLNEMAV